MEYFKSLTTKALAKLITSTQKELYLCMPALHPEIADAITELDYMQNHEKENVRINLLVDFDAQTFRQGYGNFQSVEDLFNGEFEIKNLKDNRISFIISDNTGYYLFIESRSLIPADKETINAVKIDSVSRVRLKNYFFPNEEEKDFQNELANAIIEESKTLNKPEELIPDKPAPVLDLSIEMVKEVKTDLKKNPPLNPDYKRIVEYYSNKFQYAKLHFEGQNFSSYSVKVPSKLLPYNNEELRKKMTTKLKLFDNINQYPDFKSFDEIKQKKKELAKRYLVPLKSRDNQSVLKIENKISFKKEVTELEKELNKRKSNLYESMLNEIKKAKLSLHQTLYLFILSNPTPEMREIDEKNYSLMARNISDNLIAKLNIPDPMKWISNFRLTTHFSDITYEDLKDKELLSEFKQKKIIDKDEENRLADFGKGIKINTES